MVYNPIAVLVQLCGVVVFALSIYAWTHRARRGAATFAVFMFSMSIYILGYSMELTSPDLESMLFWNKFQYIGTLSFPTLYLLFVLEYADADRWLTRRNIAFLFILPAVFLIVKLFDGQLRLIYASVRVDSSGIIPLLEFTKKDAGFDAYWIVITLNRCQNYPDEPERWPVKMLTDWSPMKIKDFFQSWAMRLMERLK